MKFTLVCIMGIVFGAASLSEAQNITKCFEADRQNNDLRQDDRHHRRNEHNQLQLRLREPNHGDNVSQLFDKHLHLQREGYEGV